MRWAGHHQHRPQENDRQIEGVIDSRQGRIGGSFFTPRHSINNITCAPRRARVQCSGQEASEKGRQGKKRREEIDTSVVTASVTCKNLASRHSRSLRQRLAESLRSDVHPPSASVRPSVRLGLSLSLSSLEQNRSPIGLAQGRPAHPANMKWEGAETPNCDDESGRRQSIHGRRRLRRRRSVS